MAAGERARIPIVDSHHHVWDPAVRPQTWLDSDEALAPLRRKFAAADLARVAAEAGVTATVVVQTVTEPTETPELLALESGAEGSSYELLVRPALGDAPRQSCR